MDEQQTDAGSDAFDRAWRDDRPFLVDLTFRMLGNIGDAEDVVQEAFARLLRADAGEIDDARAWLVVVASRLSLDILRSARVRRRGAPGEADDAFAELGDPQPDPADRVTLDDSVRMALLVVLEALSPAERAVFVLHDVFRYPFEAVAPIVGRSADACRKLASRARRRIDESTGPARFDVTEADHRRVAERFIAACAGADLDALMALLDPEVSGQVDVLPDGRPGPVLLGRAQVARGLLLYFGPSTSVTMVPQTLDGWPGVLAFENGHVTALLVLESRDGVVVDIHGIRNPETLAAVGTLVEHRRTGGHTSDD